MKNATAPSDASFETLAAHDVSLLTLLPSGPDVVREAPLRETRTLRSGLSKERIVFYHVSRRASTARPSKIFSSKSQIFLFDLLTF